MTELEPCPVAFSVQSADPSAAEMEASRFVSDGASSPSLTEGPVASDDVLNQLSRQLEYYFSTVNLSRDTYLRTLRELNDGYVPASILANFAKVQLICPYDSYTAVINAVTNCSENLEVVFVDKETSRKVHAEGPHTLLAIGPKYSKPIELPTTPTTPRAITSVTTSNLSDAAESISIPHVLGVQNTIILREVKEGVTEDDIRELFDFENCPPIQQVVEDISSFWFVTLSTTSRNDMVDVMLALRSKTLKGEPLKVRLKSGNIPSPATQQQIYVGDRNLPYDAKSGSKVVVGNHHKKKAGNPPQGTSPREGKRPTRRNVRKNKKDVSSSIGNQIQQAPPPPLVESQFPSLEPVARTLDPVVSTKSKEDDDESKPMSSSDGASTATTSSSSSVMGDGPKPKVTGGYAAALLKPAPVIPPSSTPPEETKIGNGMNDGKKSKKGKANTGVPKEVGTEKEEPQGKPTVIETIVPMAWGGGRSFADVLKKEETADHRSLS